PGLVCVAALTMLRASVCAGLSTLWAFLAAAACCALLSLEPQAHSSAEITNPAAALRVMFHMAFGHASCLKLRGPQRGTITRLGTGAHVHRSAFFTSR